jgi:hypothetical protein
MGKSNARGVPRPPQINNLNPASSFRIRYNMGSGTVSINPNNILASVGNIATGMNTLYSFWGSVKISSIEMWCPSVNNATTECSVEWIASLYGKTKTVQDASNSVTYPAHIKTVPPKETLASFWQSTSTDDFFNISTSASNTIVDLTVSLTMGDNFLNNFVTTTIGAATVGNIYYLGLDGLDSATSKFNVLSLPTL